MTKALNDFDYKIMWNPWDGLLFSFTLTFFWLLKIQGAFLLLPSIILASAFLLTLYVVYASLIMMDTEHQSSCIGRKMKKKIDRE